MSFRTGPYAVTAVICERVLEDKDGVLSLIRVIDRITRTVTGPNVPEAMPTVRLDYTAVVTLKSGSARGRHTLKIRPEAPSGQQLEPIEVPVFLEGDDRGVNAILFLGFDLDQEGLYWFDVLVNDELLTRMPLRVIYQPQRTGTT